MKRKIINLCKIACLLLLASALLLLVKNDGWISTLLLSVSIQLSFGCVIMVFIFLYRKEPLYVVISCVSLLAFTPNYLPYLTENKDGVVPVNFAGLPIQIAQFNVLTSNETKEETIKVIKNSSADIVSLQETDIKWVENIKASLSKTYPYAVYYPVEKCCYGITLLSKIPLHNSEVIFLGGIPSISAEVIWQGQAIHILSSHTSSPISRSNWNARNHQLKEIKKYVATVSIPVIFLGDLNTVPWDKNLRSFKQDTNLTDSRRHFASTFPSYLGAFGIPIDYIMHSREISCIQFESIYTKGSDHKGIAGKYVIN